MAGDSMPPSPTPTPKRQDLRMTTAAAPHRAALCGTMTALVTPFNNDGSLDLGALEALVDWQLEAGIEALVPCGTTGEACTLSDAERAQVIACVAKRAAGRVPIVAGTGSYSTQLTLHHQRQAQEAGATVGLVVTPYYNKPTPEGLYRHFSSIAEANSLPVVVYNVPSRTGCDLGPAVLLRLANHPNIVGIKEATGELDRVQAIRSGAPHLALLSGDDGSACAFTLMGGDGVISVAANVAPVQVGQMIRFARAGNLTQARALHSQLRSLFEVLFLESNPIPVKAALAWQNRLGEHYRLPLCALSPEPKRRLHEVLNAMPKLA